MQLYRQASVISCRDSLTNSFFVSFVPHSAFSSIENVIISIELLGDSLLINMLRFTYVYSITHFAHLAVHNYLVISCIM